MADGSDHSGEQVTAGRTNRTENRTRIWAQNKTDADFEGDAILIVEVSKDVEDLDDFNVGEPGGGWQPNHPVNGIEATAVSGPANLSGNVGGIGVVGRGGHTDGTGVLGMGSASAPGGTGGIGLHGIGGPQKDSAFIRRCPPEQASWDKAEDKTTQAHCACRTRLE